MIRKKGKKKKKPIAPAKKYRVNRQINAPEVRVIDDEDQQLGTMPTADAASIALHKGMDLVEMSASAHPPVCRILDFGKFLYQKERQARKQKKVKLAETRSIRISPNIAQHDLAIKAKKIAEFLEDGDMVRVEIFLRGREKAFRDAAREKLMNFINSIKPAPRIDQEPKKLPSGFSVVISKQK